jgi:hypothetical protein
MNKKANGGEERIRPAPAQATPLRPTQWCRAHYVYIVFEILLICIIGGKVEAANISS